MMRRQLLDVKTFGGMMSHPRDAAHVGAVEKYSGAQLRRSPSMTPPLDVTTNCRGRSSALLVDTQPLVKARALLGKWR